jgi:polysaccharide export outer membrane protein
MSNKIIVGLGRFAATLLACVVLTTTPMRAEPVPAAAATAPSGSPAVPVIGPENYVLGPTDKLRINVYGEEALSGEYLISQDGKLSLPLVGNVKAAGLTVIQLQDEISAAYKNGYLKDPKVSAEVISARPFYIMGEVRNPGQYPFVAGLTVLSAVATAGGYTYRAETDVVYIRHANESDENKYDLSQTTQVLPGDTVRIAERWF